MIPPLDFTLYIGNFTEYNFIKGIIYTREGGKTKIYKGKMKEGKKDDDNAETYENDNKIFFWMVRGNIMTEGRIIFLKNGEKETAYYFTRKGKNSIDGEIDFDDDKYIKKLNEINNIFDNERLQDLYISVMKIREKINSWDNFEYMQNLNYDMNVKQELKDQYGRYLYC